MRPDVFWICCVFCSHNFPPSHTHKVKHCSSYWQAIGMFISTQKKTPYCLFDMRLVLLVASKYVSSFFSSSFCNAIILKEREIKVWHLPFSLTAGHIILAFTPVLHMLTAESSHTACTWCPHLSSWLQHITQNFCISPHLNAWRVMPG